MGRVPVDIIERSTNTPYRVLVDPTDPPEKVAEIIKQALGTNEPIVFYRRTNDGREEPIQPPSGDQLIDLIRSGQQVLVERERVYGGLFESHIGELTRHYNVIYDPDINGFVVYMYSTTDRNKYIAIILRPEPPKTYPNYPPEIYIVPYPEYVQWYDKYSDNHARYCCWEDSIKGNKACYLHLEETVWKKIKKSRNPLIYIFENVIQGLDLWPLRIT